jgi:hypothetical protein
MSWTDLSFMQFESEIGGGRLEPIEVIGTHLRVSASINLGRFHRLSDLVNHTRGSLLLRDARLLRRNGDPTRLTMPELLLNQDEVAFIGQREPVELPGEPVDPLHHLDRPTVERRPRRMIVFTSGHAITGSVYLYQEQTLAGFVDASDPRFVAMTNARARSLADRRVISHFALLLVNRTQMIAVAESTRLVGTGGP